MTGGPLSGLEGTQVVDLSHDIAGAYCCKLLGDAGAAVVNVEPPSGHPLRRWSRSGSVGRDGDPDGALFRYLAAGHTSVVIDLGADDTSDTRPLPAARTDDLEPLLLTSDVVVLSTCDDTEEDPGHLAIEPEAIADAHPDLVVVAHSPFGLTGPRRRERRSEFLLQALAGSLHNHGTPDGPPLAVGGSLPQFAVGLYGALGAATALATRRKTGRGGLVDVSALEAMALTLLCYQSVQANLPGGERRRSTYLMIPGIEPCGDGYVGLATITAEQWHTFLAMIEHADLAADPTLLVQPRRAERPDVVEAIHAWTMRHTAAEIVEIATHFRIPSVPIGNGATLTGIDHVKARELFVANPRGDFPHPRPPFRTTLTERRPVRPAPPLGGGPTLTHAVRGAAPVSDGGAGELPLAGVRILDLTAFLAGPFATQYLATAGADVIKVESIQRPDPMRFSVAVGADVDRWYERGNIYLSVNLNKRGITLNLADPRGRDLLLELVARSDVVIENFTPRVMEQFGLAYDDLRTARADIIMVRMPGFGLEGPWRDRPGFAASMEQLSGMAWVTGYLNGTPSIPGICDPIAGAHAAFAVMVALGQRARTGKGQCIELAMLDMAANLVAEQVLEHEVYGHLMTCQGNRGATAAPQGAYPTEDPTQWVALSVATDAEWSRLRDALGDPVWCRDPALSTVEGRRAAHDGLDDGLGAWCSVRTQKEALAILAIARVPAEPVVAAYDVDHDDQMIARRFWESVAHPVAGEVRYPGWPMRFSGGPRRWFRTPAPLLGQHNDEVLGGELGLSLEALSTLRDDGVIGERPAGL